MRTLSFTAIYLESWKVFPEVVVGENDSEYPPVVSV